MKNTSKTIIFFGTDEFSLATLQGLIESGYNIAAVVTKPDSKSGRGHMIKLSDIKKLAIKNNIDVWQPSNVSDINEKIINLTDDLIGIVVSYGRIIPKTTIDLFPAGIINIHPSLLPKYRGPSPIESAIENGDAQTGISIILLTTEMDAGPVYKKAVYQLSGHETRLELRETLAKTGAETLLSSLPDIIDGSIQPTPQDNHQATYCKLLDKNNTLLKQNEITAVVAERLVRAHLGYPKTKIDILNHHIIITKAHVSKKQKTKLDILCKDGLYLSIDELIAPSGRTVSSSDFINGYNLT